jgi:hypothetical protein
MDGWMHFAFVPLPLHLLQDKRAAKCGPARKPALTGASDRTWSESGNVLQSYPHLVFHSFSRLHCVYNLTRIHKQITMSTTANSSFATVGGKTSQLAVVCHGATDLRVVSPSPSPSPLRLGTWLPTALLESNS